MRALSTLTKAYFRHAWILNVAEELITTSLGLQLCRPVPEPRLGGYWGEPLSYIYDDSQPQSTSTEQPPARIQTMSSPSSASCLFAASRTQRRVLPQTPTSPRKRTLPPGIVGIASCRANGTCAGLVLIDVGGGPRP